MALELTLSTLSPVTAATDCVIVGLFSDPLPDGHDFSPAGQALDAAQQVGAAQHIAQRQLSVRAAEKLVRQLAAAPANAPQKNPPGPQHKPRDMARVEEELADLLMAQVDIRIKKSAPGSTADMAGEIAIGFGSLDALNGLIERLRGTVQRT